MLVAMTAFGFAGGMNNAWRAIKSYARDAERGESK